MILIPKPRLVIPDIQLGPRVGGRYRARRGKNLGHLDVDSGLWVPGRDVVIEELDWWENIITDQGLDYIGQRSDWMNYCHVGTGTNSELATDTALQSFLASKLVEPQGARNFNSTQGSSPYYGRAVRGYRFAPGTATGNISEVGISIQAATGGLFSRARVKDGGGSPTTITVLADEYLDVDYEFRSYPAYDTADLDSIVSGENFLLRAALVTQHSAMGDDIHVRAGGKIRVGAEAVKAYSDDATLGAVTAEPSATSNDISNSWTDDNYGAGNYYRDITYKLDLDDANFGAGNGIKAIMFHTTTGGAYQLLFDNEQPKDNTEEAELEIRLGWSRAAIP